MLEQREGGCHCGRVRFQARVDLDLLSQCNCSICTKKGILHLPIAVDDFELLRGKNALTVYTFETGVAQHAFCSRCGMHAFYIPRSQPDRITVNARCLDDIDGPSLKPTRFFEGRQPLVGLEPLPGWGRVRWESVVECPLDRVEGFRCRRIGGEDPMELGEERQARRLLGGDDRHQPRPSGLLPRKPQGLVIFELLPRSDLPAGEEQHRIRAGDRIGILGTHQARR